MSGQHPSELTAGEAWARRCGLVCFPGPTAPTVFHVVFWGPRHVTPPPKWLQVVPPLRVQPKPTNLPSASSSSKVPHTQPRPLQLSECSPPCLPLPGGPDAVWIFSSSAHKPPPEASVICIRAPMAPVFPSALATLATLGWHHLLTCSHPITHSSHPSIVRATRIRRAVARPDTETETQTEVPAPHPELTSSEDPILGSKNPV